MEQVRLYTALKAYKLSYRSYAYVGKLGKRIGYNGLKQKPGNGHDGHS